VEQLQDVLIRFMDIAKKALRVARKTLEHRPTAERSTKDAAAAIEEEAKDMEFQNVHVHGMKSLLLCFINICM